MSSACGCHTPKTSNTASHSGGTGHHHDGHEHEHGSRLNAYLPALFSFMLLMLGLALDFIFKDNPLPEWLRFIGYVVAYLPVGLPVIKEAIAGARQQDFFTEFSLMVLATLGAMGIGEYPEAVAVMLFYAIGELFQGEAVRRAKGSIKALLDIRPSTAEVWRDGVYSTVVPQTIAIGERIQVKVGEKVALDGVMLTAESRFDTAALSGESQPKRMLKGEQVLAGMVNLDQVIELTVSRKFEDSALSRILEMVQNASTRKAKTELMIRRFAKVYTPIVFALAALVVVAPYFVVDEYVLRDWFYRALVFLVISCPCALVISIPLGYFGGIGAASRNGILFKGGNYLDVMANVNTVVMDKTGTLTEGVFAVQEVIAVGIAPEQLIQKLLALECKSTHPIAKAIVHYAQSQPINQATEIIELAGYGMQGRVDGQLVMVGNAALLKKHHITYDSAVDDCVDSLVAVAIDGQYVGYVVIADRIKNDALQAMAMLRQVGVAQTVMLSGDKSAITQKIAQQLGIDRAFGDLLPADKVAKLSAIKQDPHKIVAFVGDGINDAPVLALSDVGIAMGGMGSDVAIETADVVIQTDQPSKIATAIKISQATRRIVWQNIALAFGVKAIVLLLGAGGLATMWEAVFADVGVALLAVLNAVRIQRMHFD